MMKRTVCMAAAMVTIVGAARADVLLDRLGPTDEGTSSGRSQLEVSGLPSVINTQKMVAVPLTVEGQDYFLTSVDSSFSRGNTSLPEVTFELWGSHPVTGNPDRDQILEISPTRLAVPVGTGVVRGTFVFSGQTRLTPGVAYWIVARKQTGPGSVFMTENQIGNTDQWVYTSNGFLNGVALDGPTFFPGPALRVNGDPAGCESPHINLQPQDAIECPQGSALFSVDAGGPGPLTYRWQLETSPGTWTTLGNDPLPLACGGFAYAQPPFDPTARIGVHGCPGPFHVRATVGNDCSTIASAAATLTVCGADFNCDGAVNSQDFFDFLTAFFASQPNADFNADGVVNSQDFFDFLAAFFAGCN